MGLAFSRFEGCLFAVINVLAWDNLKVFDKIPYKPYVPDSVVANLFGVGRIQ
jgi:hypothetical protein